MGAKDRAIKGTEIRVKFESECFEEGGKVRI